MRHSKFIIVLLIVTVLFSLAGCSKDGKSKDIPLEKLTPSQALINYFTNMDNGNYTEAAKYVSLRTAAENDTDLPTYLAFVGRSDGKGILQKVEVLEETIEKNKAIVRLKIHFNLEKEDVTVEDGYVMHKEDDVWKIYINKYELLERDSEQKGPIIDRIKKDGKNEN